MDIFRSLTTGGFGFDKKRFKGDIELFQGASSGENGGRERSLNSSLSNSNSLPEELDFFGDTNVASTSSSTLEVRNNGNRKGNGNGIGNGKEKEGASDADFGKVEVLSKDEVNAFLKRHKIKQTGTDVPTPLASWSDLKERWKVAQYLLNNLMKFGWAEPTAVQRGAMPVMLDNRDTLIGAPTGSGKTLTYLLPLLHHLSAPAREGGGYRAVIVCPTRELATQIHEQLRKLGDGRNWQFHILTKPSQGMLKQDPKSKKNYDILITTPLRLVHAIREEEVDLSNVRHLILDEADRLLEEGFLEQTDSILAACTNSHLRKALTSATLPSGIEELAKTFMVDECRILVGQKDAAVESVEQELLYVSSEEGKLLGLRNLIQKGQFKPPILLFVQSIERAQELFRELVYDGIHVDVIHGDRPRSQREGVISAFKRGDVWVLICTELLARGMDFKGVNLVVNYDFPQSVQSYVHRIGRTGRAGRLGKAVTFFTRDDAGYLRSVVNVMRQSGCEVPEWMLKLPNANKKAKKQLKRKAPERQAVKVAAGSTAGRKEANKRRDMVEASKRRGKVGRDESKSKRRKQEEV